MSQNLLVCQHCQTYFFTDLEETNCCPHCNSQLEMSDITYENYKSMPKVKKCKNCNFFAVVQYLDYKKSLIFQRKIRLSNF